LDRPHLVPVGRSSGVEVVSLGLARASRSLGLDTLLQEKLGGVLSAVAPTPRTFE
jgi:hypothetical protein